MEKIKKIKNNYEFRRAYSKGKSFVTPFFVVYIFKNRKQGIRLGITTGKKIGGAVERNRAKRVIRAAFGVCHPKFNGNYDVVVVARKRILDIKSTKAADTMREQLESSPIWVE